MVRGGTEAAAARRAHPRRRRRRQGRDLRAYRPGAFPRHGRDCRVLRVGGAIPPVRSDRRPANGPNRPGSGPGRILERARAAHRSRSEGKPVKTEQAETSSNDRNDALAGLESGGAGARGWLRKITDIPEFGVVAACVAVFIVVTLLHHDFSDIATLQVIGLDLADYGILAVGVSMVIITSGIDLSPGSMVAFCSMCSAYVNVNWHWPVGLATLASIGIGVVVGYLHGWFVTRLDVPPFAMTLVTLTAAAGGALALTQGQPISGVSTFYDKLTLYDAFQVPIPVVIFVVVAFLAWLLMERTYIGRQIYAVGGNREAARLAGIPINRRLMLTYIVSAACAGLVGVLVIGRIGVGDPSVGSGWELDAIAASVIGGVSLYG